MSAEALYDLGIPIERDDEEPLAYAECIRIARRLRTPGYSPIGMMPADEGVAASPVTIQLASSIVDVTGSPTAYVDGLARIPIRSWSSSGKGRHGTASMRWLRDSLAVVTPALGLGPSRQAVAAEAAIAEASADFRHVLVDLTELDRIGELERVIDSLGRVVVVASAIETTEAALLAATKKVPAPKRLGVILVG